MSECQGNEFDDLTATRHDVLRRSFSDDDAEALRAREAFFEKYRPAVFRYSLCLAQGDLDLANEVVQDFAQAFVSGRYGNALKGTGRFRYYLKTSIKHLFLDRIEKRQRSAHRNTSLEELVAEAGDIPIEAMNRDPSASIELPGDEELDRRIRENFVPLILRQAWEALAAWSAAQRPDPTYPGVTTFKFLDAIAQCEKQASEAGQRVTGEELCRLVNTSLGINPPMNYATYRQRKSRGSMEFARFLLDEIRASFQQPDPDVELIEEECIALGFQSYVGRAWPKWKEQYQQAA